MQKYTDRELEDGIIERTFEQSYDEEDDWTVDITTIYFPQNEFDRGELGAEVRMVDDCGTEYLFIGTILLEQGENWQDLITEAVDAALEPPYICFELAKKAVQK